MNDWNHFPPAAIESMKICIYFLHVQKCERFSTCECRRQKNVSTVFKSEKQSDVLSGLLLCDILWIYQNFDITCTSKVFKRYISDETDSIYI